MEKKWEIGLLTSFILGSFLYQNVVFGIEPAKIRVLPPNQVILPVLQANSNPNFNNPEIIKRNLAEVTKEYVRLTALASGVNPQVALWIVKKESNFDPNVIGDTKEALCPVGPNKGKIQRARGIFQLSDCWHPNISDEVAFSVASSTAIAMKWLKEGKENWWSVFRFCREWYTDCPF